MPWGNKKNLLGNKKTKFKIKLKFLILSVSRHKENCSQIVGLAYVKLGTGGPPLETDVEVWSPTPETHKFRQIQQI